MFAFFLGFVLATAGYGALMYLGWMRVIAHLRGNAEASQAFTAVVLIPLFGRRESEPKKAPQP